MRMPPPPLDSSWALHCNNFHDTAMKFMHVELVKAETRLRQQSSERTLNARLKEAAAKKTLA